MSVIRWVSFLIAAECLIALWLIPRGVASMILAAVFFLMFTVICWSFGAFSRRHTDTHS